jgi:sugar lactone lactonase YvrE
VETVLISPLVSDYLALDRTNGDLYTTNYSQVSRIRPDGTISVVATAENFVTGIAVSAARDVYFADTGADKIFKRTPAGTTTEFVTGLNEVIGLWMSPNNDGFWAQTYRNPAAVYFIAFNGTVTEIKTGLAPQMTDVVVDEDGNIYMAYFDFGRIDKIAPDGTLTTLATIPSWLGYMTYHNGFIFATAWETHRLYRIEIATGDVVHIAGIGTAGLVDGAALTMSRFNEPNGIVASITGDTLWVTDIKSNALRMITGVTPINVGVEDEPVRMKSAALAQNFPNPFDDETTIPYSVSRTGHVTVTVIDLLGRVVETLVSQIREPGEYSVGFSPGNRPSGLYFYRIETDDARQTRQMIVLD